MEKTLEMTKVLENLKKLQDILSKKYSILDKIDEAPKELKKLEDGLTKYQKEYDDKREKRDEHKEKISDINYNLEITVKSRESGEKGMDDISSHREYEVLDKQIKDATEREAELRRDLQKEERHLSDTEKELKEIEGLIDLQKRELSEARAGIDLQIRDLKKELAAIEKKEGTMVPDIDPETVYKFQRIIQRNSEGIVSVKGGVCGGCHMILPAQFANEVRDGEKILFCPYCSRILFYQESKEEEDFFVMNDAGSLADLEDDFEETDDDEETKEIEEYTGLDEIDEESEDEEEESEEEEES